MHDRSRWALWAAAALAALGALLAPSLALAQGSTVYQNGTAVANHIAKFVTNGRIADGGGILGDGNGLGVNPFAITDNNGPGVCSYNSTTLTPGYHSICLGHSASGDGLLSSQGGTFSISVNGVNLPTIPGALSGLPNVATNAALKGQPSSFAALVVRQDFDFGRGAPPLFYQSSASPCSLNAGAGDDGSQVRAADGNCWIARFPYGAIDPMEFGAIGDGVANDHTPLQAAASIAIAANAPLVISRMYKTSALDFTAGPVRIQGATRGGYPDAQQTNPVSCTAGFVSTATNIDGFIKLTGMSSIRDLCLKMNAPGTNASGRAITNETVCDDSGHCPLGHDVTVSNVMIQGPCIGIALSGSYVSVLNGTYITELTGSGCGGVRIGAFTNTRHSIQPKIDGLVTFGKYEVPATAQYGVWIQDAGGPILTNNALQTTNYGLMLKPGLSLISVGGGQNIQAVSSSNNYWGDTVGTAGILIDATATSLGFTDGPNVFINDWVAGGVNGVEIRNSSGAANLVGDFVFTNFRAVGPSSNCVYIPDATVFSVKFIGLNCRDPGAAGVNIPNGMADFISSGATFKYVHKPIMPACYNLGATMDRMVITGNIIQNCTSPFTGALPADLGRAVIANNQGVDDIRPNIPSGGTIYLFTSPIINLTGTTPVGTIVADPNIQYTIICTQPGGLAFNNTLPGTNLFNSATCNPQLTATYIGPLWVLK